MRIENTEVDLLEIPLLIAPVAAERKQEALPMEPRKI